jgi:ABC-2 type transport system permease protein
MSAFAVFFTIAEIVAVVSNGMLAQSGFMMVLTASGILLMSVSLTSLSVGLGAIFPSFDSQNPARIASGGGGMIAALLSLAYVGLMVVLLALPAYKYSLYLIGQTGYPKTEIISSFLLVILLNILASYLPLKLGIRAIKRKDF